jgi:hypothetical protein
MEKNKGGRPPYKTMQALVHRGKVPETWAQDILDLGSRGKTQVHIVSYLNISWDTYKRLQQRDPKFLEIVNRAMTLSEQWWIDVAQNMWVNGNAKSINSNHWSLMMRNIFRERWSDRKDYDIKTDGKPITNDNNIIVEIIKPEKDDTKEIL